MNFELKELADLKSGTASPKLDHGVELAKEKRSPFDERAAPAEELSSYQ